MTQTFDPWDPPNLSQAKRARKATINYTFGQNGTISTLNQLNASFWNMLNFNPPIFGANGSEPRYGTQGDLQTYTPDAISVTSTELVITASKAGDVISSGVIRAKQTFRYGLVEASLWVPKGPGMCAQLWLYTDDPTLHGGSYAETDVMESLNNPARGIDGTWSWANGKGYGAGQPYYDLRTGTQLNANSFPTGSLLWQHPRYDITDGFHRFQCLWVPGYTAFYLDNEPFLVIGQPWKTKQGPPAAPAGITLNLAVGVSGNDFAGVPTGNDYPAKLHCQYIRVWQ